MIIFTDPLILHSPAGVDSTGLSCSQLESQKKFRKQSITTAVDILQINAKCLISAVFCMLYLERNSVCYDHVPICYSDAFDALSSGGSIDVDR